MRVLDLTLRLEKGMRGVDYETKYTVARDGWNARTLHLYSHCGTHMDSPYHFEAGEQTIDQIPIADCIGNAWVVALDNLADQTPITLAHLGPLVDQIRPGDGVLLRTLWSRHVGDADHYRDHFPPISPELARWMVQRQVRMVGVEPPSVADVNDLTAVTEIHQILLGAGIIIVEGLTGLDQIDGPKCIFGAMPLKIAGGDGAPCRAFAIVGADW
ncbi:Kynurenine formamidase [Stieleria maiorica]|uniref:Kynurenine formamidase n=1 Tax=Stieleria maiorica TaxID=2795974 RepID=A0A5B9MK59_9BACT|nr:cyclase family protein [Stieleria maiorica]QEG00016.1 Kynurenine formamidase [Stieleria maiorica]